MQKKILAAAIGLVLSGAAAAQSSGIQIYGSVDFGYSYRFDRNTNLVDPAAPAAKSNSRLDGGLSTDNFIGFKGSEDLGGGTSALFALERSFNLDTGADGDGFDLAAYLGLETPMGSITGGRIVTPYHELVGGVDPFAAGNVGTYQNVKKDIAENVFGEAGLFDPDRVSNALLYTSPELGGFNFTLGYANEAFGADSLGSNAQNNTFYTVGATYATDNALFGATYHRIRSGGFKVAEATAEFTAVKSVDNFSLGGFYDFETVKVSAFYSMDKAKLGLVNGAQYRTSDGKTDVTQHNFMVGANIPFGRSEIKASVNYSKNKSSQFGDALQFAVGYDYNFSARTAFYAAYAWIDNDQASTTRQGRFAVTNDTQNEGGIYQQAFQVGIRHSF